MTFFTRVFLLTAAAVHVHALKLDGTPLKELLVDHGNGTVFFWTEQEHPDLELSATDLVDLPSSLELSQQVAHYHNSSDQDIAERALGNYIANKFCDGFRATYPSDLYDDSVSRFCGEMEAVASYYFASMIDIFEHEVCRTAEGHSFKCGFMLDVIEQAAHARIGPEARSFCHSAFSAIHKDCDDKFGGVDVVIKETNGNSRHVEYRTNAIDDSASSCAKIENPTPGRPHVCKVHSG